MGIIGNRKYTVYVSETSIGDGDINEFAKGDVVVWGVNVETCQDVRLKNSVHIDYEMHCCSEKEYRIFGEIKQISYVFFENDKMDSLIAVPSFSDTDGVYDYKKYDPSHLICGCIGYIVEMEHCDVVHIKDIRKQTIKGAVLSYRILSEEDKSVVVGLPEHVKREHIVIPESIMHKGNRYYVRMVGNWCNQHIKSVVIPDSVYWINDDAFMHSNLESVHIGCNVKRIGVHAFFGCNLKEVVVPDSVTRLAPAAFSCCGKLEKIYLGKGVKRVGGCTFRCCHSLKNIYSEVEDICIDPEAFFQDDFMERTLRHAIELATEAHKGQTDRAGKPYIDHITRVMQGGKTVEERMAGILHDIVEDTDWTFEKLADEGIPPQVIAAVRCLTKQQGEDYEHFIERVKTNPIAIEVKLNDLRDNLDITRLSEITDDDVVRLRKYHRAYNDLIKLHKEPRKIVYVDMDNVLVDFESGIAQLTDRERLEYHGRLDEVPNIFSKMKPKEGAVEAVKALSEVYDVYILSTAPWKNPSAWCDKLEWVKKYLGCDMEKRLILSHHKNLNRGDYLIDDRLKNGAAMFNGELIQFGSDRFPNWYSVTKYLLDR